MNSTSQLHFLYEGCVLFEFISCECDYDDDNYHHSMVFYTLYIRFLNSVYISFMRIMHTKIMLFMIILSVLFKIGNRNCVNAVNSLETENLCDTVHSFIPHYLLTINNEETFFQYVFNFWSIHFRISYYIHNDLQTHTIVLPVAKRFNDLKTCSLVPTENWSNVAMVITAKHKVASSL